MLSLFLDFDGVLVDSNNIKEKAFLDIAFESEGLRGFSFMESLRFSHPELSRHSAFQRFSKEFDYSSEVCDGLVSSFSISTLASISKAVTSPAVKLIGKRNDITPYIVSAADQGDLETLIDTFGWSEIFEGRIWGSPRTKKQLFSQFLPDIADKSSEMLFAGDAKSDFKVSQEFALPFAYISGWSKWIPSLEERQQFAYSEASLEGLMERI